MRSTIAALALTLLGCGSAQATGPTTPPPEPPPDCAALRSDATARASALEACRASAPASEWAHREDFEWLDAHVGAHLEAARASETTTLSMEETQAIADRVWALLDAVREDAGDVSDRTLFDRTEDAAEAVMRDRDAEGRTRALAALAGALGALRNDLEPAPPPSCELEERESAAAWMRAQVECAGTDGATIE